MEKSEAQEIIGIVQENNRKIKMLKDENDQLKVELIRFCVKKGYFH